jgi:hypothetical protein
VRFFLRQGQAMQLNFAELNDGGNPAQGLSTRDLKVAPNTLLHKNAAEVRTWRKYTRSLKLKQVTLELSREALETIASIMRSRGGIGKVREVHFNRGEVTDATYKFLVTDAGGRPSLFVALSPSSFPSAVADAVDRTAKIRSCLGPDTGQMVLLPLHIGHSDGASYSLTPYCKRPDTNRLTRFWNRRWLRGAVGEWLLAVSRETVAAPTPEKIERNFMMPLRAVVAHPLLSASLKRSAQTAIDEIEAGTWRPLNVLAHNDFWEGNVLLPDRPEGTATPPFFVIDWGGSNAEGYAIYDLARMAMSFRMPNRLVTREIMRHCELLSCSPRQARNHVAAALGHLALNLGQFPERNYAELAESVHQLVEGCLRS